MNPDSIPKIRAYSLGDFHDFDECVFKFFLRHHLDKKYEISKGSPQMALGVLLDKTIKNIHARPAYDYPLKRLLKGVRFSAEQIRKEEMRGKRPNFNTATVQFLTEDVILAAEEILRNYYHKINGKFKRAIAQVSFFQKAIEVDGTYFKLWGGPDTLEMGDDGLPEIVDYKSRENLARGKEQMDMDLMPKIYTLLLSEELLKRGFDEARFLVKFWQDPKDESFAQIFDLKSLGEAEDVFKEKIRAILKTKEIGFCSSPYCEACNNEGKDSFADELRNKFGIGIIVNDSL